VNKTGDPTRRSKGEESKISTRMHREKRAAVGSKSGPTRGKKVFQNFREFVHPLMSGRGSRGKEYNKRILLSGKINEIGTDLRGGLSRAVKRDSYGGFSRN